MSQTQKSKKSPRMGGTFDEFLREEGMYEAIQTTAMRRILAMQLDGTAVGKLMRGAGHTYGRYGAKTPEVTLERIANDGIEVAQYLLRRLHNRSGPLVGVDCWCEDDAASAGAICSLCWDRAGCKLERVCRHAI